MRLSKLFWLGLGGAAVVAIRRHLRRDRVAAMRYDLAPDPLDPVQSIDGTTPFDEEDLSTEIGDVGDLYGMHTSHAVDRTHRDDDAAFETGQNWLESLETDSAEYGIEPEEPLEVVDDADIVAGPHHSDTRDRPIADRGSGGRSGM